MKLKLLTMAVCAFNLAACTTITRGTNDVWVAETNPAGANVTTTNGYSCTTPCSLKMPRKSEFGVRIEKEGYKTIETQVTNRVSGAGGAGMAGNVLVGGIIGAAVDAGTGAMLDLTPNPLVVELEQDGYPMRREVKLRPLDQAIQEAKEEMSNEPVS